MKLVLNLDENVIRNINGYCDHHKISADELVEDLFTKFVQEPADSINEFVENNELDDFYEFGEILKIYLYEVINSIQEDSESDEAYDTDKQMINVFKELVFNYIDNGHIATGLYKAFKEGN